MHSEKIEICNKLFSDFFFFVHALSVRANEKIGIITKKKKTTNNYLMNNIMNKVCWDQYARTYCK